MKTSLFGKPTLGFFIPMVILSSVFWTCTPKDPSPTSISPSSVESLTAAQIDAQTQAKNVAKALAFDLNRNIEHRKEVLGRIANEFDGDFEMLLSHLSPESIKEIQAASAPMLLEKSSSEQKISSAFIEHASTKYPLLQLLMPYAKLWNDDAIQQSGGLIVAYYPFGLGYKKVQYVTGYDKDGKEIRITRETAKSIPYILVTMNERVDDQGFLKLRKRVLTKTGLVEEKRKSIYGINPKDIPFNQDNTWRSTAIPSLAKKDPAKLMKALRVTSEDGNPPPPANLILTLGKWQCDNGDAWGSGAWLEGDPEFYCEIETNPNRGGLLRTYFPDRFYNGTTVYSANSYELGNPNSITLKVMEEDGGALGPDDFIDDHWQYGLYAGGNSNFNITPSGTESWFTGYPDNCVLTLWWH